MPVLLSAALLFGCKGTAPESGVGSQPNIVFIMADDLGYAELGCYGQEIIRTPNIDRLRAQGIKLTQHYTGAPVCAPARCVLMTGRNSARATVRDNQEHQPEGQLPIGSGEVTVADLESEKYR